MLKGEPMINLDPEQLKVVIEFAEWLEEKATTNWQNNTLKGKHSYIWSVPRKTSNGEWYSNWTTEALWAEFIKLKVENKV